MRSGRKSQSYSFKSSVDPGRKSDRLLDWIEEGNSYIQAVYAENADESRKDMLTEKVFQCYITNNAAENALLVQVRGE